LVDADFPLRATDKLRNYAAPRRDRWTSLMERLTAGGDCATSDVPLPKDFPGAVQAEIVATQ
jgi:hypothetical protein